MFFSVAFYVSLTICFIGILYKISRWFSLKIGPESANFSFSQRIIHAVVSFFTALFSLRLFVAVKVFVFDVIFQTRILKGSSNFVRLLMHILIFSGFILLLLMHALEEQITEVLFYDYASTLNPFMFLRNLFGAMVLMGLVIAWLRRKTLKGIRTTTNHSDQFALIILFVIIASGFLLEGAKIISAPIFDQMAEDYGGLEDPEEIKPLQVYWAKEFSVVFPGLDLDNNSELFEEGLSLHEGSCIECHSKPEWAFVSFQISWIISPMARHLNKISAETLLLYLHVLACFAGLAYLPFSKYFHIIASPVSLLAKGVIKSTGAKPANAATLRAVGLDACTHCGTCSLQCSVAPVFQKIPNKNILPSEKLKSLRALASGRRLKDEELNALQEGTFICTDCFRCTEICPAGINLQDLWAAAKNELKDKGFPEPYIQARNDYETRYATKIADYKSTITLDGNLIRNHLNLSNQANTFSACFKCSTCTNACPVVANYEEPEAALGMTPHQIMHSLGLGLGEMVLGTRMIWDCVTCYKCQEHCPQGVHITDIFYELKNLAHKQLMEEMQS